MQKRSPLVMPTPILTRTVQLEADILERLSKMLPRTLLTCLTGIATESQKENPPNPLPQKSGLWLSAFQCKISTKDQHMDLLPLSIQPIGPPPSQIQPMDLLQSMRLLPSPAQPTGLPRDRKGGQAIPQSHQTPNLPISPPTINPTP